MQFNKGLTKHEKSAMDMLLEYQRQLEEITKATNWSCHEKMGRRTDNLKELFDMGNNMEWDERNKENIYNFIFEMAFRDATLRNAFTNPFKSKNKSEGKTDKESEKQAEKSFEELKNDIRNHTKDKVAKYLKSILDNEPTAEVLDQKYICLMEVLNAVNEINTRIKDIDSKHKGFTFGNVQKLVNMSAKYLYIACYANPEMRTRFDECDCPMDSIMIKGIIKEAGGNIEFEKLKDNTSWSGLSFEIGNCENVEVFQKLIPKEYVEFQKWIRNHKDKSENMLDYDFRKWTEWSEDY